MMRFIRALIYRLGFRPKRTSIFYSPSIAMLYHLKELNLAEAFMTTFRKQR